MVETSEGKEMKLKISADLSLPADAVTQTFAVLAKKRVGKTYTASVMAEEFVAANIPFVVLDPTGAWWGLRSGKNGKPGGGLPVYVIGGQHGIPLEPTAGKVIADQVVNHPSFYVIDVSLFESNAAQDRFALDFGERLYRAKEKRREPMHLFVDEADAFMPQRPFKGQERMLGAFEALVRRGGIRGIGVTLITQRAAIVNKNVLTQVECLIILQTTGPQDKNAIHDWVKDNGTPEQEAELMQSISSLSRGEAWIWSPAWLEMFKRIHIRERNTFNSSATPRAGEKPQAVPTLAAVNLEKLSQEIKATIERAKENDPEALRKRIRELERAARDAAKAPDPQVMNKMAMQARQGVAQEYESKLKNMDRMVKEYVRRVQNAVSEIPEPKIQLANISPPTKTEHSFGRFIRSQTPVPKKELPIGLVESMRPEARIKDGARRMLAAAVKWNPNGITAVQMKTQAAIKHVNTFSTYKTQLISSGLLVERMGLFYPTEAGIDFVGGDIDSPSTTQEVLNSWLSHFKDGARRMMLHLVSLKGEFSSHEDLMEAAHIEQTQLKSAHLVVEENNMIAANKETLFL
jgi:hypothetical protein